MTTRRSAAGIGDCRRLAGAGGHHDHVLPGQQVALGDEKKPRSGQPVERVSTSS